MTPEQLAIKALAEVLPSREVTALALEYQLDAAKHGTWRGRQQAQEAVAAAIWSRIDRDTLRAALLADLRSPRNELGLLALPKGRMELAVEEAWEKATWAPWPTLSVTRSRRSGDEVA